MSVLNLSRRRARLMKVLDQHDVASKLALFAVK
jgi:hypothetical protein